MCILWYYRDIKVNPTFLSFPKLSGGVKMTLIMVSCFSQEQVVRMGNFSPPGFQFPVKELVASLKISKEGFTQLLFFCIIYTGSKLFIYE
jgi:hypothetical protein